MDSNINSTHDQLDWTNKWDQNEVAGKASLLVDNILIRIFESKLEIHQRFNLNLFEIKLLYRWPLHVGVNIFIERLLRVSTIHKNGGTCDYPLTESINNYHESTVKSVQAYYYDPSINYELLSDLAEIFDCTQTVKKRTVLNCSKPKDSLYQKKYSWISVKKLFKLIYFSFEKIYIRLFKPKIIGERSFWFRKIYFFGHSIDFNNNVNGFKHSMTDSTTRDEIIKICSLEFVAKILDIIDILDDNQIKQFAKVFAGFLDHVLSLNVIEGLKQRFVYYENMLSNWPVKQVHAFTGYFYNDNFKIFAIIAKRNGAKLVGHSHGVSNYLSLFYKGANELYFLDYFTTYGLNKVGLNLINPGIENVKFIPTGSTAFNSVPKWNKPSISTKNLTLLYPSGPLMDFMSDLQEISPEKNTVHRLKIINFLDRILFKYQGLKILYKPFPGTFTNDPIKTKLSKWFDQGRIKLTYAAPQQLFPKVDIVLWDSISTGFAESIVSGVPVVVFNSSYEYERLLTRGKVVNDALFDAGIQCFDVEGAEKSVERILNDLHGYNKDIVKSVQMFKQDFATAVSKKEWHQRFKQEIGIN